MKILQVCSADSLGGGEQHVMDLTRGLLERGHELHLAVRPNSPLQTELADFPIHWHEVKLRNALDVFSAQRLSKLIVEQNIEVVHAHVARDYPIVGLATKNLPVRFFLTRHHFNPIKSNKLYEAAIRHATKLIAVSATVQHELAKAFPALAAQIEVIPNWLDPIVVKDMASHEEARRRFKITKRSAIAVVGQITPLKRQDLLLEALRLLTSNNDREEVEVFLFGITHPKDKAYEQRLRAMADTFGLANRIHFKGYAPALAYYLSAFDLVVIPSDNEGFSLAAIEAMNAGCAVVASEVGGLREIILHNQTGILFPPGNAELLANYLQLLLSDDALRHRLATAGQTSVRARFNRQHILDRIETLYATPK